MTSRSVTHATFSVERRYDVSPAEVFAAWSDPAAKARWFAESEGWTTSDFELDFRIGGRELFRGRPEGGPLITYRALYQDIVPEQRIVYSYAMDSDETRISVSLATVQMEATGAGTRLVFTEQGAFLDDLVTPASREQGMGGLLDALGTELAGGATSAE
jgi:uncharacterized protein YndB with AHSA1/START domain